MAFSKNRRLAQIISDTDGNLSVLGITVPTQSASDNDTSAASTAYVTTAVANVETSLIDSAPDTLNTLNEIAAALNDEANFGTTVTNSIAAKLPLGGGTMTGNIAHASDFTLDIGGDLTLDADGGDIKISDGGTQYGLIANSSSDLIVQSTVSNKDIIFRGNDGGSTVVAMTLDMSEAGKAIFNAGGLFGSHTRVNGDFSVSASSGEDRFAILPQSTGSGTILMSGNEALTGYEPLTVDFEDLKLRTFGTERMRIDTSGKVGIATSTNHAGSALGYMLTIDSAGASGSILEAHRTGNSRLEIYQNSTGGNYIDSLGTTAFTAFATGGTERMRITADGNLKFTGKTTNFDGPGFTYHTNNYLYLRGGSAGTIISDDSGINTVQIIDGSSGYINFETGDGSSRMRITADGKVGINTTAPSHQLHIKGPSSAYGAMRIESTSTGHGAIINLGDSTDEDYGQIVQFASSAGEGGRMRFIAGGTETLNLRGGKVGIGTTSPDVKLDVRGEIAVGYDATYGLRFYNQGRSNWSSIGNFATDTTADLSFKTGGGLAMTMTHNKDVGIGITVPSFRQHVYHPTTNVVSRFESGDQQVWIDLHDNNSGNYGALLGHDAAADILFMVADAAVTKRFVIDNSGNVGIGTDNPSKLGLTGSSAGKVLELSGDDCQVRLANSIIHHDNSGLTQLTIRNNYGATSASATMRLEAGSIYFSTGTSFTERLRINHLGRQVYNASATANAHGNFVGEVGSGYKALAFERTVGGGEVGSVVANSGSTSYYTTSDYRLKENVNYTWDATERLKQLKPARFNYIADDSNTLVDGFLAHEVSSIVPEAILGEKDAVNDDGNPEYQGIDHSKLVPLLVKTIQELEERLSVLENK